MVFEQKLPSNFLITAAKFFSAPIATSIASVLPNAWITAREFEKAVEPLSNAASLSESGDTYARLGQVFLEREEDENAIDALESAFEKGDLKNPGRTYLLLGICNFNVEKLSASRKAFRKALEDDKTKKIAAQWITHVDNTIRMRET